MMSTNIKRSYNNLTRSMLKIQNCFSPSSSHNKIISDINLRVSTQRNEQSNKAFHFKKQSLLQQKKLQVQIKNCLILVQIS